MEVGRVVIGGNSTKTQENNPGLGLDGFTKVLVTSPCPASLACREILKWDRFSPDRFEPSEMDDKAKSIFGGVLARLSFLANV